MFRATLFFLCLFSMLFAYAQLDESGTHLHSIDEQAQTIVVTHANGQREDAVRFVWERNTVGGYNLLALSRDGVFPAAKVSDVMRAALGGYLDVQIKFGKNGVQAEQTVNDLTRDMEAMMNALLATTAIAQSNFLFSQSTRDALSKLSRIDWSNTSYALEGDPGTDKYVAIYKFVRMQRNLLEASIEADLQPYAEQWIRKEHVVVANHTDATVCGTVFDEDKYLCALDLQVNEVFVDSPEPGLSLTLVGIDPIIVGGIPGRPLPQNPEVKVPKRDRWLQAELARLNERMDKLDNTHEVSAIRDRIAELENRLSSIEADLAGVKADQERVKYDNPIENLSVLTGKNVTIHFANGSTGVSQEYMVLLNEVFDHLARSPDQRILITGYSDKVGSSEKNLRLSELRAKAVRDVLLQRGIAQERVLVNYFGDSKSNMVDPKERRVEIEWLQQ